MLLEPSAKRRSSSRHTKECKLSDDIEVEYTEADYFPNKSIDQKSFAAKNVDQKPTINDQSQYIAQLQAQIAELIMLNKKSDKDNNVQKQDLPISSNYFKPELPPTFSAPLPVAPTFEVPKQFQFAAADMSRNFSSKKLAAFIAQNNAYLAATNSHNLAMVAAATIQANALLAIVNED